MQYAISINGESPIIMHDVIAAMDDTSPASIEIKQLVKKRGKDQTESDRARLGELETIRALWRTIRGDIGIPERALRSMLETAARKLKEGPKVREGLRVLSSDFTYDVETYGRGLSELSELARTARFSVPVRVQSSTVVRTRAKFEPPWSCRFVVDVDEELVDEIHLRAWLDIGGRRIGLGDWRPARSGVYGTFAMTGIEVVSGK